jgi:hypothetical protein
MGTLKWSKTSYCKEGNKNVPSTATGTSGNFTTSTSAGNVTGLTLKSGDLLEMTASEDQWVNFYGTAANGTGRFLPAGTLRFFQADEGVAGTVSAKDEL